MSNQLNSEVTASSLKKGVDFVGVAVVYFCHDGNGRFIMHKRGQNARDEHGRWDCGAGGLELGDSVEQTLRKEIREEFGADVISFEFLGYRDTMREQNKGQTHWINLDFKVQVNPAQVKNNEPHKFDEVNWFTLESLPPASEQHSQLPYFINKYRDRLQ